MNDQIHQVSTVQADAEKLILEIDGKQFDLPWSVLSKRLAKALPQQRLCFEVSESGYGIHWPLVDEDLSIDGILRDFAHQPAAGKRASA